MIFRRKKSPLRNASSFNRPSSGSRWKRRRPLLKKPLGKTLSERAEAKPERRKPRVAGFWAKLKRTVTLIAITSLLATGTYYFLLSNRLDIKTIEIFQDDQPLVQGHPMVLLLKKIKGKNLLLLNTEEIEAYLKQSYAYYAELNLKKSFPDTLVIQLKTHPIVAELQIRNTDNNKKNYLLNAGGLITLKSEEQQIEGLPLLSVQMDQPAREGQEVIPPDQLAFALESAQSFEDKFGMEVVRIDYQPLAREAHLITERNFAVWLDITMDLDEQLNKLKQALPRLNLYEEPLEYIDLRISGINGEKVIFKRR